MEPLNPSFSVTEGKFQLERETRQELLGKFYQYQLLKKHEIKRLENYLLNKLPEEEMERIKLMIKERQKYLKNYMKKMLQREKFNRVWEKEKPKVESRADKKVFLYMKRHFDEEKLHFQDQ